MAMVNRLLMQVGQTISPTDSKNCCASEQSYQILQMVSQTLVVQAKKKKKTRQSSEEVMVDSIHTPTEENCSDIEDEFVPDSPGVEFEHDPSDVVGDVTRDNDAGESPK